MSTQNNHHSDLTVADVMLPFEKNGCRKHLGTLAKRSASN